MSATDDVFAPYNFVPLAPAVYEPERPELVSHDLPFRDGLSGSIPFTIVSDTPLLIGGRRTKGSESKPAEVHFCRTPGGDGHYFVPGSSIRGMIRNVVEIASFARMRFVDDRRFSLRDLTRGAGDAYKKRMSASDVRAGWLSFGGARGWEIDPCEYGRIETALLGIGEAATFQGLPAPAKYQKLEERGRSLHGAFRIVSDNPSRDLRMIAPARAGEVGAFEGDIVVTGQPDRRKKKEFVFYNRGARGSAHQNFKVPDEVMSSFFDIHETAAASADPHSARRGKGDEVDLSSTWRYFRSLARADEKRRIPVFFHQDAGRVVSLGLARMYKLPTYHRLHELIAGTSPAHLGGDGFDLAELIFGRIGDPKSVTEPAQEGLRGRVSFGNALWNGERGPQPTRQNAGILSTPKPSFTPAYLEQPGGDPASGKMRPNVAYRTYDDQNARLRGWKRYPVRPASLAAVQPVPPDLQRKFKQQTVLNTLPAGSRFAGVLRIHNLRPFELGAILWAMTWGGAPELRHALGMGKPFGFGQTRLEIDQTALRSLVTGGGHDAPNLAACLKAFEDAMTGWATSALNIVWRESDQIRALLAMADPSLVAAQEGMAVSPAGPLKSMLLGDFAIRKGAKGAHPRFLKPYVEIKNAPRPSTPPAVARASAPPAPAPGGPQFRKGQKVYAHGELAVMLQDVTAEMIREKKQVTVEFAPGEDDVIGAHQLKPAR